MMEILNQGLSYEVFLDWLPDLIGCMGTLIILIIYALLQIGKVKANSFSFPFFTLLIINQVKQTSIFPHTELQLPQ